MKISKIKKAGFTLIELMVVIAIIGILTAIITENFATAKSKARDAQRVSDLSQIQLALAGYFDRCNAYPPNLTDLVTPCVGAGSNNVSLGTFISKIPSPPTVSESYLYIVDNGLDDYFIAATLENPGNASNNSLTGTPSWYSSSTYALASCSATGYNYCVGPK
jgi:prepilin-type N-terminal cleavage/methylation domain-containing protein